MPRFNPPSMPEHLTANPSFRGERLFWEACAALPDDWIVMHGVGWTAPAGRGRVETGEVDFIILAPGVGIIVVEFKGGSIKRVDGQWFVYPRGQAPKLIKSPIEQLIRNEKNILRILKGAMAGAPMIPIDRLLAFSAIETRAALKSPDLLPHQLVGADFFSNPMAALAPMVNSLKALRGAGQPWRSADCLSAEKILRPNLDASVRWTTQVKIAEAAIENLTAQQQTVLKAVRNSKTIGLSGPAGSGKTILALHHARDVLQSGGAVLAVLPNSKMRDYYRAFLAEFPKGVAISKHDLLSSSAAQSFNCNLVVIDEAQALALDEWDAIESCAKGNNARLLVVFDTNQRLRQKEDFYLPDSMVHLELEDVVRNAVPIAKLSTGFFRSESGIVPKLIGPDDGRVSYAPVPPNGDLISTVATEIKRLVTVENAPYGDIVVLCGKDEQTLLKAASPSLPFSFVKLSSWTARTKRSEVAVASVTEFIGLESPCVILTNLDNLLERDFIEAIYVGVSRAKYELVLIGDSATLAKVKSEVFYGSPVRKP